MPLRIFKNQLIGGVGVKPTLKKTTCEFSVDPPSYIWAQTLLLLKGPWFDQKFHFLKCYSTNNAPWKIDILNPRMEVWWKMILLFNWVIFRWTMLIFRGVFPQPCFVPPVLVFFSPESSKETPGWIPPFRFVTCRYYQGGTESPLYGGHKAEKKVKIWVGTQCLKWWRVLYLRPSRRSILKSSNGYLIWRFNKCIISAGCFLVVVLDVYLTKVSNFRKTASNFHYELLCWR